MSLFSKIAKKGWVWDALYVHPVYECLEKSKCPFLHANMIYLAALNSSKKQWVTQQIYALQLCGLQLSFCCLQC